MLWAALVEKMENLSFSVCISRHKFTSVHTAQNSCGPPLSVIEAKRKP
jgi:hypothetical protein